MGRAQTVRTVILATELKSQEKESAVHTLELVLTPWEWDSCGPGGGAAREGAASPSEALCGAHSSAHTESRRSSGPSTPCGLAAWPELMSEQLAEPSHRAGTVLHPPWTQPFIPLGGF